MIGVLFTLLALSASLPLPLPIPAPNLPSGNPLPESLSGAEVLIIGGTKGIGSALAYQYYNRNANVTITTRDLESASPVPFKILEVELGRGKSVERLVEKYLKRVGRIPDILVIMGLTSYVGNLLDFTRDDMEYATRMYITDPILLVREFLKYNNQSIPFNVSFALSTASYGAATDFISLYAAGKTAQKDFITQFALYEGPRYYPNVRLMGVACSNVNTSLNVNAYNPSLLKGDPLNTQLQAALIFGAKFGTNPVTVALAHLEATTTLTFANSSLFLVPTSTNGRIQTEVLHAVYVQDTTTQYVTDMKQVYLGYGLNITRLISLP